MRARLQDAVAAAAVLAVGLAGCGTAEDDADRNAADDGGFTIGLLLPENQTSRYEEFDRPLITKRIEELCADCTVEYANAQGEALLQRQQVNAMISKGAEVLLLNAVEPHALGSAVDTAADAGVPVIAYDREVEGAVSAFITFTPDEILRLQSHALRDALGERADGARIVRVEGPVVSPPNLWLPGLQDRAEVTMRQAARWNAESSYSIMTGAIAALGPENIDGVFAANDALAAGVIPALKDAGIERLPPVTGQDAELGAVQRIIEGEQYMTVYKAFPQQADAAAEVAVALGRDESIAHLATERVTTDFLDDVPSILLDPIAVTAENVEDTIIRDGFYSIDEICIPRYRPACDRAGLTG
ncbi:substrate-binding domain-containing protein [Streptomyces sp. NBC_01803]|uniref:substrate-binding domain-containing protein n=1 Tax=Streptomyces sp. NBC_01803 TaxID=2975946 RepID=UPI002DDC5689|nr:substrate-binding domain-containing protein [Streptomyces sp. NBC_01803]WSA47428.1 substrate-binding domain-containing protein [Streptomyces sp. NBC_01803]